MRPTDTTLDTAQVILGTGPAYALVFDAQGAPVWANETFSRHAWPKFQHHCPIWIA